MIQPMMSSDPAYTISTWQVTLGIVLSLIFLFLIEKIYGLHANLRYPFRSHSLRSPTNQNRKSPLSTFPGFAPVLGPGETQSDLIRTWVGVHQNLAGDKNKSN